MTATDPKDHPDVIVMPPLAFLACAGAGFLLHHLMPVRLMRSTASVWIGVAIGITSVVLAIWAQRAMKHAGTNVRPDRPTVAIVKNGPYMFTRNPMYLSLCLLQVSLGFLLDDPVPSLLVIPLALVLNYGVICREERYLEAKFGEEYLTLKREVRRWI